VLGVSTLSYLPYAFFNIASPLLSVAYGFTGFQLTRLATAGPGDAEGRAESPPTGPLSGDER